jgi:hypothetical protein
MHTHRTHLTLAGRRALRLAPLAALVGAASAQELLHRWEIPIVVNTSFVASEGVGDVDGDGFDDIAYGARLDTNGRGRVDVRSGRSGALLGTLTGAFNHENFGQRIVALGDVDQDGFADFAVSAPGVDSGGNNAGRVAVFHGPHLTPGLTIDGAAGERLGLLLEAAGDVDADGVTDIAEGTDLGSPRLRLYSGATGALLREIPNMPFDWSFAHSFAGIGDVDGDGHGEVAVGIPGANPIGPPASQSYGAVQVRSGATGAVLRTILHPPGERGFGTTVAAGGDIDGDGIPDVLVGSPNVPLPPASYIRGKVFAYSGRDGSLLHELRNADTLSSFGEVLAGIGDLDADGFADIAAGSSREDFASLPVGEPQGGVQVFSGASGALLLDLRPQAPGEVMGLTLRSAGDVNADGYPDLVVGSIRPGLESVQVFGRSTVRGTPYCLGQVHSAGDRARLTATSSSGFSVTANDVTLEVSTLPPDVLGYFMVGREQGIVPGAGGGQGTLCIAGPNFGRYAGQVLSSGALGRASLEIDANAIPMSGASGSVAAQVGDTFGFQFWFRDTGASGAAVSNLSDAFAVTFR